MTMPGHRQCLYAVMVIVAVVGAVKAGKVNTEVSLHPAKPAANPPLVKRGLDPKKLAELKEASPSVRAELATKLLDSPSAAMRHQALLALRDYPTAKVGDSMRRALKDMSPVNRALASAYLAKHAGDREARLVLLRDAADEDANTALPALEWLGRSRIKGEDVERLLRDRLRDKNTPAILLHAAILGAGYVRARSCVGELVFLLDNRELRMMHSADSTRICDLAATALEEMYGIYRLNAPGAYFAAPVAARDRGIAAWKAWYAAQKQCPDPEPRISHISKVIETSLAALRKEADPATRATVKSRLRSALQTTFCLGELPGVDAVAGPCLVDVWKIMRASGERWWYRHRKPWRNLETAFNARLLAERERLASRSPEQQALAFTRFAKGLDRFPRIWVWALCQNFSEVYPRSPLNRDVLAIRKELESGFSEASKQVVRHGHIPVLEPIVATRGSGPRGGMLPKGGGLGSRLDNSPSDWGLHSALIAILVVRDPGFDVYPALPRYMKKFPGNEWPFIGAAAFEMRVKKRIDRAVSFANKALILNETNAKAYAVRGAIRVVGGGETDLAHTDLKRAYDLDPGSLGGEPETLQIVLFLVEQTAERDGKAAARKQLKVLGELQPYGVAQRLKDNERFQALAIRLQ